MVVIMKPTATEEDRNRVENKIRGYGADVKTLEGEERTVVNIIGDERGIPFDELEVMSGVERAIRILKPYKLVSREAHPEDTIINVNGVRIGKEFVVMAGPCSVEYEDNENKMLRIAEEVKNSGAKILRGGAYKPRTSPYSSQGLREEGLKILAKAKKETGLPIITEVLDTKHIDLIGEYTDIFQIGMRNMRNFELLKEVGKTRKPVLLKRGDSSPIEEWLQAAEYILFEGNQYVILCERGIKTFETYTRNTFDISAISATKDLTHLPVIGDPSHATGRRELIYRMSKAATAAGADGLLIEAHYDPDTAWSDSRQTITTKELKRIIDDCNEIYKMNNRYT